MTHWQCFFILSILFLFDFVFIGHCQKYHYMLKIVIWVVLHVNLSFALSSVHNLHVQCRSVCRKFAYSANLGKCSTLAKVYFIQILLSFITFRSLATREITWRDTSIRKKATASSTLSLQYVPWILAQKLSIACTFRAKSKR